MFYGSSSRSSGVNVMQVTSVCNKVTLLELKTSPWISVMYVESSGHEEL